MSVLDFADQPAKRFRPESNEEGARELCIQILMSICCREPTELDHGGQSRSPGIKLSIAEHNTI